MNEKKCALCGVTESETSLYEGVYDREMIFVCQSCAREEGVPIIRKPSMEQLKGAEKTESVRERMEKMSGMRKHKTELSDDQRVVLRNLTKLRIPEPKQKHPDVEDNYYWEINMARRRKKMTLNQLSNQTGISLEILENLEKGKLPENFKEVLLKLEDYFEIKLLKHHKPKVNFYKKQDENMVLDDVKNKIKEEKEENSKKNKKRILRKIEKEEIDFSKPKDLENITLNDLIDIKRKKEREEYNKRKEHKKRELFGDDILLDE